MESRLQMTDHSLTYGHPAVPSNESEKEVPVPDFKSLSMELQKRIQGPWIK